MKRGFTLVELMLAMTFLTVMLLAIAMTVIHISNVYARGITLTQVNRIGREVVDDMQRTIMASPATEINEQNFVQDVWGGRLCLGTYSYAWNTGVGIEEGMNGRNQYEDSGDEIHFVRVNDRGSALCRQDDDGNLPNISNAEAVEMMNMGDRPLVIHDMHARSSDATAITRQRLYAIEFTLGTSNMEAIDTVDRTCLPPAEAESDINYCAINSFAFTVRAGIR